MRVHVRQKQLPALFKISGGQTMTEHEVRTNLTAKRYRQPFFNDMATDGIKIIDGDTAHDTYWGIMDLYDSGADFSTIENEFPLIQDEFIDEFENEIYVTAIGLAFWEIGNMTKERLNFIREIIDKGACVKEWAEQDEKLGKARQNELEKYWNKISQKNTKIRQRKKYRKISNFYFLPNALLAFKLTDNNYRAVICARIDQYRGQCNYIFVPTTYNSEVKPTIDLLKNKELFGIRIASGFDRESTISQQPDIERVWSYVGGNSKFLFGLVQIAVSHKDFISFKDKFEVVGELKIVDSLKRAGSFGFGNSFDRFEQQFIDLDKYSSSLRFEKFPIEVICDL